MQGTSVAQRGAAAAMPAQPSRSRAASAEARASVSARGRHWRSLHRRWPDATDDRDHEGTFRTPFG
jgi:hypothetical protein